MTNTTPIVPHRTIRAILDEFLEPVVPGQDFTALAERLEQHCITRCRAARNDERRQMLLERESAPADAERTLPATG